MSVSHATDTELAASYRACRRIAARHGRTYFLATRLLPAHKRPAVHALYALARTADDLVDTGVGTSTDTRRERLRGMRRDIEDRNHTNPIFAAAFDTIDRFGIPWKLFAAFFDSMEMDLTISSYATFAELSAYTYGSAEVIGLQLLPILEPADPTAAAPLAAKLGLAFQLTNFIRDVGEDLDRGRVYLPVDEIHENDLTIEQLQRRVVDDRVRSLLSAQIARTREIYSQAEAGIELLHRDSQDCVRTAFLLYRRILDEVEANDYDVFTRRATVPNRKRLAVYLPALTSAVRERRPHQVHQASDWSTKENPNSRSSTGA